MHKRVLTIIVSYNFEPWIHKCIQSIISSTHPSDIIVIDNASTDNTVSIIKEHYNTVFLIESSENLGFGKANNIGMEYAIHNGYDFVFLVNQDAWIDKYCIEEIIKFIPYNDTLLSPIHYDGTENSLDKGFEEYSKHINLNINLQKVEFVNAAFWFIPVDIIKHIGLFSAIFYHYGEDKDFCNRLKYHGIEIRIVNTAKAYHDRQNRDNHHKINFRSEFVYHLSEFCNINYTWIKAFANAVLATCKKSFKQALKGKFDVSKNYLLIATKLCFKIIEVTRTRKTNKAFGSYINH